MPFMPLVQPILFCGYVHASLQKGSSLTACMFSRFATFTRV